MPGLSSGAEIVDDWCGPGRAGHARRLLHLGRQLLDAVAHDMKANGKRLRREGDEEQPDRAVERERPAAVAEHEATASATPGNAKVTVEVKVSRPRPGSEVRSTIQTMTIASTTQALALTAETAALLKKAVGTIDDEVTKAA